MARTIRNEASYIRHPNDGSRKVYQRQVNKRLRRQTKDALRTGGVLPVVRREVDYLAH